MIHLNLPGMQGILGDLLDAHIQAAGGPVFLATVWGHCLEYFHPAISFQVHHPAMGGNGPLRHRPILPIPLHRKQPIVLQAGKPIPAQLVYRFQVGQTGVPASG